MISLEILAQNPSVTNWLTPVWLLSVGISAGLLLVLISLLKIWFLSRFNLINSIADGPLSFFAGALLSLFYLAIAVTFFLWAWHDFGFSRAARQEIGLFLVFAIPLSLLLGVGGWRLITRKGSSEVFNLAREGFLYWTNIICLAMFAFAIVGYGLAMVNGFGIVKFVNDPYVLLNSASRLPVVGRTVIKQEIPPTANKIGGTELEVSFFGEEVRVVSIQTDQPLEIATEPISKDLPPERIYSVSANSDTQLFLRQADGSGQIPNGKVERLFVVNIGNSPANFSFGYATLPVHPEVWLIPWAAFFVLMLYLAYLITAVSFPKMFAIAFSTFKTEINQPLFTVILAVGLFLILVFIYVPYNTFGEDIKMYKDSGLTLIRVLAIFMAVWAASKSVAEEIEGRTALTVLSKPVGRRQFILGKFGGIGLMIGLLFLVLGIWFIIWTAYKPIYDGKESVSGLIEWEESFAHAIGLIPAIFLAFMEVLIFAAVSVAISTRMGILPNFLICFAIYVLGHLTPLIVQSSYGEFEIVHTFGNLIAIIFPVLNHFDVQAAINTNQPVPLIYVGWSVIYCVLYGTIAMLIAFLLFEDRDLA